MPTGMGEQGDAQIRIHGMRVDPIDMDAALARVAEYMAGGQMRHIVTADASMVVTAARDPEFAAIVEQAALVTPDGAGILWAARRLGLPIADKVSGVDLSERLIARSGASGWRVFLFGAAPGVAAAAADRMRARYPDCNIVGVRDGFFRPEDEDRVVGEIQAACPDILLVAMGIPKQEKWIARYGGRTGAKVCIGVGGTLDVFSGTVQRAPVWMQRRGLEWLYRLVSDPKQFRNRLRKQKLLPPFVVMTLRAR